MPKNETNQKSIKTINGNRNCTLINISECKYEHLITVDVQLTNSLVISGVPVY